MHNRFVVKFVAVAVIVGLPLSSAVGLARAQDDPGGCSDTYLAVGGYGAVDRVPEGYTPAYTPGGIFSHEAGGFNHGQRVGAENVVLAVEDAARACPTGQIHLSGYSYGAAVVHTAVEHIDGQPYAPRVSVRLRGNPRHSGGVEDTYAGSTVLPGVTFRGAGVIPENVALFEDVCNPHDGICDLPRFSADPVGSVAGFNGYSFMGAHRY